MERDYAPDRTPHTPAARCPLPDLLPKPRGQALQAPLRPHLHHPEDSAGLPLGTAATPWPRPEPARQTPASKAASEPGPARPRPATKWRRPSCLCRYRAAPRFESNAAAGRPLPAGAGPSLSPCGAGCLPRQTAQQLPDARVPAARCAPRSCALRALLRAASLPPSPNLPLAGQATAPGLGTSAAAWLVVSCWKLAAERERMVGAAAHRQAERLRAPAGGFVPEVSAPDAAFP